MTEDGGEMSYPAPSKSGEVEHQTLAVLVDAWVRAPKGQRFPFEARSGQPERIFHPGLPGEGVAFDWEHVRALEYDGYLRTESIPQGTAIRLYPPAFVLYAPSELGTGPEHYERAGEAEASRKPDDTTGGELLPGGWDEAIKDLGQTIRRRIAREVSDRVAPLEAEMDRLKQRLDAIERRLPQG